VRRNRRERRDGWAARGRVRLNPKRDPKILYAIGRSKLLPTRDIATLAFGSRETARDRLRKLHCAGLVRAHVRALHEDNVYTLTERGRDIAVEHLNAEPERLAVLRRLPKQLDHLIGINRMRVCLTAASRELAYEPLRAFVPEWELRAARHGSLLKIIPDAVLKVADRHGVRHFIALEVDTGSENPSYVAGKKLRAYEHAMRAGQSICGADIELVVLVAPGTRRLRALARAIEKASVRSPVALGDLDAMTPGAVLSSYARPAELARSSGEAARGLLVRPLLP